ncbi:MAG: hypothetical protein IH984_08485 [Planctomycetes bacterium]|nr:hypothetical protein [Planctomycetota bacterium]
MNHTKHALSTIGWGLFCACSWTWCIGMFLPIIFLRQFGWWGFIVFAVPNVLGCAAFGYFVNKKTSEDITRKHITAMRWFSYIVIAYHMFFIPFLVETAKLPLPNFIAQGFETYLGVVLACAVLAVAYAISYTPRRFWLIAAVITYAISLAAFVQLGLAPLDEISFSGELPRNQLPWMALVIAFGFMLCPYLDLTFHHARCQTPSKHAFAVFGLSFTVMILLTCAYSLSVTTGLTTLIAAHIFVQIIFTLAAHISQLRLTNTNNHAAIIIGGILVAAASWAIQRIDHPLVIGEEFYMRFLLFFSLIFPTYILLFMGPGRTIKRSRKTLLWFFILIVASAPFYEIGFLHGSAWLLVFPIAAIFAWKLAIHFSALPHIPSPPGRGLG